MSNLKCIQFKNSVSNCNQELYFYGDIVADEWCKWQDTDTCPMDVLNILNQIDGNIPLDIYINSGGGNVFAGLAIYNMLKRCKSYKTVYVDALAGSIASVIAMCGDKLVISANSFLMIHKAWNIEQGNANDFRKMADDLDKIDEGILNVYAERLADGVKIETIKEKVDAESWIIGTEVDKYFSNVEVIQSNEAAASISNLDRYNKVPDALKHKEKEDNSSELELLKAKLQLELMD